MNVSTSIAELGESRLSSCSSDSARPCVICTLRPSSARSSFCSWLPGTQSAVPAATIAMTSRSTPGVSGPRSTRSPRNTAVRPSGCRYAPSVVRCVAEHVEERHQLVAAAVHVADDVERSVLGAPVGPSRLAHDLGGVDLLLPAQDDRRDGNPRAAGASATGGASQPGGERRASRSPGPGGSRSARAATSAVTSRTIATGNTWCSRARRTSGLRASRLHVRGIDDGQPARAQAVCRRSRAGRERFLGDRLIVRVVAHQRATGVGGDHFGRLEVSCRERRLARAAHADQHDEREFGDRDLGHRSNTAICVGGPTSGSRVPTGRNRTR